MLRKVIAAGLALVLFFSFLPLRRRIRLLLRRLRASKPPFGNVMWEMIA